MAWRLWRGEPRDLKSRKHNEQEVAEGAEKF